MSNGGELCKVYGIGSPWREITFLVLALALVARSNS
jgi:hypothetical protein